MKGPTVFGFLTAIAVAVVGTFSLGASYGREKVYVTEAPMRVGLPSVEGDYFLPKGTMLYYDHSVAEGTQVFRVYVRFDGPMIPLKGTEEVNLISPLHGANPMMK